MVAAVRPSGNTQIAIQDDGVGEGAAHTINFPDVEIVDGVATVPPSAGDLSYIHFQNVAAANWPVAHNLGKHPSVSVVDSAGSVVHGEVLYLSDNALEVNFASAFSGRAYLN